MKIKRVEARSAIQFRSLATTRKSTAVIVAWCIGIYLQTSFAQAAEIFVDASAMTAGDGTAAHPFKTIQQGVDKAQAGDTVTVRQGRYPEQVVVKHGGTAEKPLVIQARPIGSVVVDGAEAIEGFETDTNHKTIDGSSVWVSKGYHSNYFPMSNEWNLREDWIKEGEVGKRQVELLSRNDMAWMDGRFLEQVDSQTDLRLGTFFVDRKAGELHVTIPAGDRPEEHLIEASVRGTLLDGGPESSFVHIRGFHFTRGGFNRTAVARMGHYSTQGWVVEDNSADWGNFSGFAFYGSHNQILRNVASHNGCEGMQGILHDSVLDGNVSIFNNWKGIRDTYESGGGKFTESDHVIVRHHLAAYNLGPGLWFDINNTNITVENSCFHDNKYAGLFMEIGPGPTVFRGNRCWANQGGGIVIGESNNVLIEDNILASNWYGIDLRNLQGRHGKFGTDGKPGEGDWQISDVTIRRNVLMQNIKAGIGNTCYYLDPATERISSDENVFFDNHLLWWEKPNPKGSFAKIPTPADVSTSVGNSWVFDNIWEKQKFGGLEVHSVWKDPELPDRFMYDYGRKDLVK